MAVNPRVVIVGAGIVGCALADELTERGWCDVTVLDKRDPSRTAGSSSRSTGLVFQVSGAKTMTELASYTVAKYTSLVLNGARCFLRVGGVELATTDERMAELRRRHGWATSWGVRSAILSPGECVALHPLLDPRRILGGLHIPSDGLARPLLARDAQARRAAGRGARILPGEQVTAVTRSSGRVTGVLTQAGRFRADVVIDAAGASCPTIGSMVGLPLPMVTMAHPHATTTPVPELSHRSGIDTDGEETHPVLRHQGQDMYFHEHGSRVGIGAYGHRPEPLLAEEIDELSVSGAEAPFLRRAVPEDFEPWWTQAVELLPALSSGKIEEVAAEVSSCTPDGNPLVGEHPDLEGFWVVGAVGIPHSAGIARAAAEWLVEGQPRVDLHGCELARFSEYELSESYVRRRSARSYAEVNDIIHPLRPSGEPRPMRTSPFYQRQQQLGAYFLQASGWERPQWYESNSRLAELAGVPRRNEWASRHWSPIVGAEALAARQRVAMFDMSSLKRLEVTGPGALDFLQTLTTADVAKRPGSVSYTLLLAEDGGVRSDLIVARLSREHFQVGCNSNLDLDWLSRHIPGDGSVHVSDITAGTCCIGLWGPRARAVLQPLTTTDFSRQVLGNFRCTRAFVDDVPVIALRISYVGEPGWELYTTADMGAKLWDALWEAGRRLGVVAAGHGAFDSMRLEKGHRAWGIDMTAEHNPYEAGVGSAVRMDKGYFLGRDALREYHRDPVARGLTCLTIDDPYQTVMGGEPVYHHDDAVGYVTSAAYGYTVRKNIAYAWLPATLRDPGTPLTVEYFGRSVPATVAAQPLLRRSSATVTTT